MTIERPLLWTGVLFCAIFAPATAALAGGGPENVLLVVNPRSHSSLTIANHYARLRRIPPGNLLFLPWDPAAETAEIDTFRREILIPIIRMIDSRRLTKQIDYVVYSSDFPWGITLYSDVNKFSKEMQLSAARRNEKSEGKPDGQEPPPKSKWPVWLTPVGSINGLTYLWQPVILGHPVYLSLRSNNYMRLPIPQQRDAPTVGFRSNRQYDRHGQVVSSKGERYFLSTMLGVTAGRGNSLAEVLNYLRRSATADGTHPRGTIYFVQNEDVRSKVRHGQFPAVVRDLKQLGVAAEILAGTVPLNKKDVQGVVMGTAAFDWKASGSVILPGAICENFTSLGGVMYKSGGQTPLTEFLRYGAAGSSGTVTEPRAVADKFPSPMIQVHYVRGCTLAEAFYQSVYSPYQLLIVGDPLCRPWAEIPRVSVVGVEPNATVRGRLTLTPSATLTKKPSATPAAVDHFELFLDGVRLAECKPGKTLSLDTAKFADGHHELRLVAVGPRPIESQGRQVIPVRLANHNRSIEASLVAKGPLRADQPVTIAARSPGSIGIVVIHGSRVVGRTAGEQGRIEIPANTLGAGPVRLGVVGLGGGAPSTNVMAEPLEFTVK